MNTLDIKHLKLVRMLSKTGNMTRAARNLFVTQSALSQQLKDIETRLGTDLFYRTGKKMVPTRVGKMVLARSEAIIRQVEETELDIARMVTGERGELKIGVRCLFCYMWLPRVLGLFQEKFPNVDIAIGNAMDPEGDLISEAVDIAVTASEEEDPRIESAPLFEDEVVVVMSADHPLRVKPFMRLDDFHGADIIALVDKSTHYFFDGFLRSREIRPRRYMIISHPEAMVDLIASGLGVGILPQWFALPYLASRALCTCPVTASGKRLTWRASWLKSGQQPPYLKEFIKLMSAHAVV